jgi:dipeptidyl aminopeptidase/acylaminoacyl peptidase
MQLSLSPRRLLAITLFMVCWPGAVAAQGTPTDYERSAGFAKWTQKKVFRAALTPHWSEDGDRFWYKVDTAPEEWEFVAVDAVHGTSQPAFDHGRLAEALAKVVNKEHSAKKLPIDNLARDPAGANMRFNAFGKRYECLFPAYELRETGKEEPEAAPPAKTKGKSPKQAGFKRFASNTSPDGKWTAVLREHNVLLKENATAKETVLTKEGTAQDAYGSVYWSPDSSRLIAVRTLEGDHRKVYLVESSPRDQIYPRLHTLDYAKPGDKLPIARPHLFTVDGFKEIPVDDTLFKNPWSITQLHWDSAGKEFLFLFNERGHQALRLVGIHGETGQARAIINETSTTFVDYAHKFFLDELTATGELIWMSQRDGWNHLYLIDQASGAVKNQITKGEWLVRGVDRVDREKRQIWFRAGGIHADQDPYHVHYCRINFDGTGLVKLTEGDGTHVIRYSPDGRFFVDVYSRVDLAPITELRRAEDGALVIRLEKGDISALVKAGWQVPERFSAKGRDSKTDIYGVIYRPSNFDPAKKYPVIEAIYAGPQGSFVPKDFRPFYRPQEMAELGFILVQIDGMGTSNRSKAFHDVCWKNLGDSGFPDRILWIKAAAQKYPYMDIRRVGIYGGSAGGQSALGALLAHGDFYFVAAADCGCHDNRIDKIWWNELWMGYPIGPHYEEQSNVTNAHKLTGKLLLTVGELDRNVDPVSTMQVVNALIKARKDFDLLVVPGANHGIGESPYAARRRKDFFVRHLLGITPPDRNAVAGKEQ